MKSTLLIILSLVLVTLVACAPTQPESNFPVEEEQQAPLQEQIRDQIIPVELNYEEVRETVTHEGSIYVTRPADEYEDASSYNRIDGSTSFEVATQTTLTYVAPEKFEEREVPLLIIDDANGEVVYEGTLLEGTHEYKMLLRADHAGFSPRFQICYGGDVVCDQFRTNSVSNAFGTNIDAFGFNFDRDLTQRQVFVTNNGNTHLTIFTYIPDGEEYEIDVDVPVLNLEPEEEAILTFRALGTKSSGDIAVVLYALGDNCYSTQECADSARVSEEITVSFN